MRVPEITDLVSAGLNRHLIQRWSRLLGKPGSEEYTPPEVASLIRMFQASLEGLPPSRAVERLKSRWFDHRIAKTTLEEMAYVAAELASKESSALLFALLQEQVPVLSNAIRRGVGLDRLARAARDLLRAEKFTLFLADRASRNDNIRDLILITDSGGAEEPTHLGFRIRDYEHSTGWTAASAAKGLRVNKVGPELGAPASCRERPTHLKSERHSLIALPLLDRKKQLLGVMKAENRSPLEGMKLGAFDDHDERLMTAIAATTIPLLELQQFLIRGVDILSRMNTEPSCRELCAFILNIAKRITSADCGEISRWDPHRGLVFEVVTEGNELREDTVLEASTPSVTYGVYWDRKPRCITDIDSANRPQEYLECNPGMRSEIAVPLLIGDYAIGVLNLESRKAGGQGGLDEADVPIIEVLSTFASMAFQMAALRDSLIENLAEQELQVALEQAIAIANATSGARFRGMLYRANYKKGCLGLMPPTEAGASDSFAFEAFSLTSHVFRAKKGLFSRLPEKDKRVWSEGLSKLGVRGSMLGFPVAWTTALGSIVVAVIILWNVSAKDDLESRLSDDLGNEIIRRCEAAVVLAPGLKTVQE